jgi:S1-C subfamily serine protease
VRTQPVALPASLRQSLGLKQESGVLIVQIEGGSAAELGGLLLGDVILRLNDLTVEDVESLRRYLRSLRAGQTIALTAVRAGALHTMNITLGSEA